MWPEHQQGSQRQRDWNEVDWNADVHLARAMRGAECWTDHRLVVSNFQLKLRRPVRMQKPQKRLNVRACKDPAIQEDLQKRMSGILETSADDTMPDAIDCQHLTDEWSSLCSSIMKLATESLGMSSKKHQDWFDDQRHDIRNLLQEENEVYDAILRNPNSVLRQKMEGPA